LKLKRILFGATIGALSSFSLSSCALVGLEGPAAKENAQENLRKLPTLLAQLPQAAANDLGTFARGYSHQGEDPSQQLARIQRDAEWEQLRTRQQLDRIENTLRFNNY
jgi:hypothetical protein